MRSKVSVNKGKGKAPAPKRKYRKVDRSKKLAAKTRLRLNQMKIFRTKTKSPHRESKLQTIKNAMGTVMYGNSQFIIN
jgi:hypothetical protein